MLRFREWFKTNPREVMRIVSCGFVAKEEKRDKKLKRDRPPEIKLRRKKSKGIFNSAKTAVFGLFGWGVVDKSD